MNWEQLLSNAYTPYSDRPDGCIVIGESGTCYPGVRVENISYPLSISAEQIAFGSCLVSGDIPGEIFYPQTPSVNPHFWLREFDINYSVQDKITSKSIYNPLKTLNHSLKEELVQLLEHAVTPNSSFPVSALLSVNGGVITGVNIEYSDWSLGLCAERLAIGKAITAGYRSFEKLCIHVPKSDFASPCGACRQVICEWMNSQFVELYHGNHTCSYYHARELLPYAMKTSELKKKNPGHQT